VNLYTFMRRLRREAMPPMVLYCEHKECGQPYASLGEMPLVCPACEQETTWSTEPVEAGQSGEASTPWQLTQRDVIFLRWVLRIDPR
jgi:hypothetical protein